MNKLTKKVLWIGIGLLALAFAVFLIAVATHKVSGDSYLGYAGSIIGGFATMIAVVVALLDRDQDRSLENKPRIRLSLKDQDAPVDSNYVYFHGGKDNIPGISLLLENIGTTEVQIKGVYVGARLVEPQNTTPSDPGIWKQYNNYNIMNETMQWDMISDCIDIDSSITLPISVSEKRYTKDSNVKTSPIKMNRFLIDIFYNNSFYDKTLFRKRYQIDQPLRNTTNWWCNVTIHSLVAEELTDNKADFVNSYEKLSFEKRLPDLFLISEDGKNTGHAKDPA